VAHFTDTFYEINGVALTLQQQVQLATATNRRYTLITCDGQNRKPQKGVIISSPLARTVFRNTNSRSCFIRPAGNARLLPPAGLQSHPYGDTGPIGLAALAIARFLKVPISGTYHTAIPQYVQILTGSDFMEEMAWKFVSGITTRWI
jgi:hypothetical protein